METKDRSDPQHPQDDGQANPKRSQGKGRYRAQKAAGERGSNRSQGQQHANNNSIDDNNDNDNDNETSRRKPAAIISASGIHNDDFGILVTSDKGQEKKCLLELADLLSEYIDEDAAGTTENVVGDNNQGGKEDSGELDIEADILAELDSLRPNNGPSSSTLHPTSQKISLVTLDIPCVSFVRFPTTTKSRHDPVDIVRKLCQSAARKDSSGPRSRYIKRLTPVTLIRKVLSNGLESLCDEVLPAHFQIDEGPDQEPPSETEDDRQGRDSKLPKHGGCKFAIRPTIRNNNKIDRDHVIQVVAAKITELGHGAHSVDLKGYDKLVLVDVYRNVVGMSVVGGEFETLKRFNLAEIHASHFEEDAQDGKEKEKSRS